MQCNFAIFMKREFLRSLRFMDFKIQCIYSQEHCLVHVLIGGPFDLSGPRKNNYFTFIGAIIDSLYISKFCQLTQGNNFVL